MILKLVMLLLLLPIVR